MKTFFHVWPLLVSVLFVELFYLYLFVTIANVVDFLNHIFFLLGKCLPFFHVWTTSHILQLSSETVPLSFLWPSHHALSLTINFLISFYFIHYPNNIYPVCLLYVLCKCHTYVSPFSLCECHMNILSSPWLLNGHSTLFPFRS